MPKLACSYDLDYELPSDFFDDAYVEVIKEIIKSLNDAGRNGERITWIQGDFIPGKDFPLDPMCGSGSHLRILAYCYVLERVRCENEENPHNLSS